MDWTSLKWRPSCRPALPSTVSGVGTKAGVSADAPLTDCAYKLVEYNGRPVLKVSPKKQTLPGPKQVYRYRNPAGNYLRDVITRAEEAPVAGSEALLGEVMRGGKPLTPSPSLEKLRRRFGSEFACLSERHKQLRSPELYDVTISSELEQLWQRVVREATERELSPAREVRLPNG